MEENAKEKNAKPHYIKQYLHLKFSNKNTTKKERRNGYRDYWIWFLAVVSTDYNIIQYTLITFVTFTSLL